MKIIVGYEKIGKYVQQLGEIVMPSGIFRDKNNIYDIVLVVLEEGKDFRKREEVEQLTGGKKEEA